ncbi:MAG TPA: glycosyltransferase [Solirubrobacterales bacterium]
MSIAPGSVWLDARGTQSAAHSERGIPRYVAEHARALVATAPEMIGSIGLDPAVPAPESLEPLMGSGLLAWHSKTRAAGRRVPTIYHVMSPFEIELGYDDVWPAWIRESGARLVVTLYDLIPVVMRERYLDAWGDAATAWMARLGLMRRAHQILTISQQTADDAIERLGIPEERLTVIDSGISGQFSSLIGSGAEADALLRARFRRLRPGFLLYVGGRDPRKNLDGTIKGYGRLPEELRRAHQLVIVGNMTRLQRSELVGFAKSEGISADDVLLTGFVSDRDLAALYRSCALFVFSSLYEGAGLPILEAMSCGAPVVASGVSSMPELLGDPEGTFDPADPNDLGRSLREALGVPGRLEALRKRSRRQVAICTWERVARRTIEGYERAAEVELTPGRPTRGIRPGARKRKRLAVVTPWPPQDSAAARHSRRLVEALSDRVDVDVIVSAEEPLDFDASLEGVRIRTDAEFGWAHELEGYDRCLHVLGGSPLHLHALECMMRIPGVVLAHDVRLLGLYRELHRHRFLYDPYWLEDKLLRWYGERIPRADLRRVPYDDPDKQRVQMSAEVQAHAQQLLVHSRHQEGILRLERPRDAAPVAIVPHGIPAIDPSGNGAGGGDGTRVVSIGVDARLPRLLEAFAEVASRRPGSRLTILSRLGAREGAAILEMATRLGIGGAVELPGPIEGEAYWRTLRAADLAIQLPGEAAGGRASEPICDCLAARVPVIVSDLGWAAELPRPVGLPVAADCSAHELAREMADVLEDDSLRTEIRAAQDRYVAENSFPRVAERYVEVLAL